nr:hypothetical protein [Tanacetum cinerariifolium]
YSKPKDPNELFHKLLGDLKELAEYENSQSRDRSNFLNNNEDHSNQNKESLENSSKEIATSNSNEEKEEPSQDSDIHQLIREECCVEASEEQKQKMKDTMLELIEICLQKELYCMHDNVEDLIENAPILSTKETEPLSMGYENLNTTPETESDEIIKFGVEELVPILNENEVTLEDKRECDMSVCEDSSARYHRVLKILPMTRKEMSVFLKNYLSMIPFFLMSHLILIFRITRQFYDLLRNRQMLKLMQEKRFQS